jgi:hypothetical protein
VIPDVWWHELSDGRSASSLGKARAKKYRGFIVLGAASAPERLRPTVAHGVVHIETGAIEVRFGTLTAAELAELKTFWSL